jgi:EmrB/QacA subfamily drug resistance transporter
VTSTAGGHWLLAVVVVAIGGFMSVLDTSIVNVAVPVIQKEFGTSTDNIQWISTAYSLALGVIVPVSGWLGDRYGLRRIYTFSMIGFTLGSVLCGIAWDLPSMVLFRIIQAVPGGILPVASLTILYRVAPKEKIGAAMAIYGLGVVFAPGIGPTLGGYLVEYLNWRLIFFLNVPVGLLGAALAFFVLPAFARSRVGRFDVWGFVTVAAALFAVLLALSEGQVWGWTSYPILILLAGAVNLLALFVVIELHVEKPLLDVRVFALWQFTNSLLLITALSVGLFAVVFYVPLFLQEGQNRTPLHTGLLMLPEAIAMAIAMPLAGKLYDQVGPRLPSLLGLAVAAWGTFLLCGINADMTPAEVMVWTVIRGAGNGLAIMTIMTAGLAVVPLAQVNEASAINNVVQRVAAALGLAVLTSMATSQQAQFMTDRSALLHPRGPDADPRILAMQSEGPVGLIPLWRQLRVEVLAQAYSNVFLVIAVVTAIGAILALMVKKPPAAQEASGDPARSEAGIMVH